LVSDPQKKRDEQQKQNRAVSMGVMIPSMMAASVVGGAVAGFWLDKWMGWDWYGLVGGLILGIVVAVREVRKLIKKMNS